MKSQSVVYYVIFLALVSAQENPREKINKKNLKRAIEDFTQNVYIQLATNLS